MDYIKISKARENNLKDISLKIPLHKLVVVTGLSGSGKSSLAFDTIYAEAQRRYMDTLSVYAKNFIGVLKRPSVESIEGLSPTIAIEQKSTNKNPRSTVGTVTEISDFLRLLYSKVSTAYSPATGKPMIRYTDDQLLELIVDKYNGRKCILLSPLVEGRKGHYRDLIQRMIKRGYTQMRVDQELKYLNDIVEGLDRYKIHFVDLVIDKLVPSKEDINRIRESLATALNYGKGAISILDVEKDEIRHYSKHFICPESGLSFKEPAPHNFSFNSPQGACPKCKGLGVIFQIDKTKVIPNDNFSITQGGIVPLGEKRNVKLFMMLESIADKYKFNLTQPINTIPEAAMDVILYGSEELFSISSGNRISEMDSFPGVFDLLDMENENTGWLKKKERYLTEITCPECHGKRLNKDCDYFRIDDKDISELSSMDISDLYIFLGTLEKKMTKKQWLIAREVVHELLDRTSFLLDVGLSYLSLNRATRTLSGGESQRIRLATQIGSKLVNVLYILDEPSIGLHQSDNIKLINSLIKLRDEGNSVMVVEHDEQMMRSADWIIDLGPGAGEKGGELMFSGKFSDLAGAKGFTADYLLGKRKIEFPKNRRIGNSKFITIKGCRGNNLKNVDFSLPLGMFVGIGGVSGSGKSSLINDTLMPIISKHLYRSLKMPLPYKSIEGIDNIDKLIEINQSPIGRSPRSNPATYTGVLTNIRKLFEETPDAKIRGFKANKFSFNVKGGRCEVCKGAGIELIEMSFLPSVHVKCKACNGKRFKPDVLAVKYKGKNINDVLEMSISEAAEFFQHHPAIYQRLNTLVEVGLGYIRLGQSALSLSGGESQRLKLAAELFKRSTGNSLYLLDEPTTGLHAEDVKVLLGVLQKLVDQGNTVVVIEHNIDVLKSCDYLFDMGPKGGREGGLILSKGTPEEVANDPQSVTGKYLKKMLG